MSDHTQDHCELPFWKDPMILFRHFTLQYHPTCSHSPFNFTARLVILSLLVGIIGSVWGGLSLLMVALVFGLLTAMVIIMTTSMEARDIPIKPESTLHNDVQHEKQNNRDRHKQPDDSWHTLPFQAVVDPSHSLNEPPRKPVTEHFVNGGADPNSVQPMSSPLGLAAVDACPYAGTALPDHTPPTSRNLFMNILLDDIKYHPQRPVAASVDQPEVAQTMDDYFRIQWFSDPTDVFGKNQGQRQFITQPSTTVPNDQGSFANWLYKIPGKTCKEGGRAACVSGTDGGPLPWLSSSL